MSQDNPLWMSWHDTTWIPILNPTNVMEYFQEKSNPFYDRTCNNEIVKMQRVGLDQMANMTGREYILLHVQGPILYVIRKQHRHSPTDVTPMADFYIIAGTVYQAPDLASVFNSRLLSITQHLQSSFEETSGYSRYHPNKGYSWDFSANKALTDKNKSKKKETDKCKEETSSFFQRKRVDMLLGELLNKFPLPLPPTQHMNNNQQSGLSHSGQLNGGGSNNNAKAINKSEPNDVALADDSTPTGIDIKQEVFDGSPMNGTTDGNAEMANVKLEPNDMKPPPEKKMKL